MLEKKSATMNKTVGILSVILLLILFTFNIVNIRSDIVIQMVIYFIFAALAMFTVLLRKSITTTCLSLLFFSIYAIMVTIISQSMNLSSFVINFGYITLWIWVILIFTYVNENDGFCQVLFSIITAFSIFIGIYLIFNYDVRKELEDWGFANNNYYLLCSIPIIMLSKNKLLKKIALVVAVLAVLFSLKRTGILALGAMGVGTLIYKSRKTANFGLKAVVIVLIFVIVAINYDKITELLGIDIFYRFDTLEEDGGSGRGEIYKLWFELISNSRLINVVFGCGYNGMINFHQSTYSAHNDIMEFMMDYGVVGIVFYFIIVWRYLKVCIFNVKNSTQFAAPCVVSICAFIIVSLFSHCIIYPSYFMYTLIFWIYIESQTKKIKQNSN